MTDPDATLPPAADVPTLSMPADAPLAAAPTAVPGYEMLGELGRGGMGVVYKARHTKLNRVVALKMILGGGHAGASDLQRFRIEAEALAHLQHPNVVQIHDVGEQGGCPYISLEFCAGGSLAQQLAGTPLPPGRAAELVQTLARAIHAAHQVGIIHRDLKPANVLLAGEGTLKLTDFGLAKRAGNSDGPTVSGTIMGTPSYMAPEQAGSSETDVGPAADIYALGAILYECLTGRPPFRAATPFDTVLQVLHDEPVPPSRLNARVPRDLETIALKCLQKVPSRRYASAADLADDLQAFAEGLPIKARPIGPVERAVRWTRRHPTAAALGVACSLLVGVGGLMVLWSWRSSVQNAQREAGHRREVEATLERARRLLYVNSLARAEEAWRDSDTNEARRWLLRVPRDLRGWEWHYARRIYQGDLFTLAGHSDTVTSVAASPNGRLLVSGSADRTVKLWDAGSGKRLHTLDGHAGTIHAVAFSPDGTKVVSAGAGGKVVLWDARRGVKIRALHDQGESVLAVAFAPDGRRIACGGEDRLVRVFDAESGKLLQELTGHDHFVTGLAFHPRQPWLATACADNLVRIYDLDAPTSPRVLRGHTSEVRGVSFSPDGTLLASASWDKRIRLWDAASGKMVRDLIGHTQGAYGVAFSPDGKRLASASGDRTARLWDVGSGQALLVLPGHSHYVTGVAFSHDSTRLIVSRNDQTVKVWDLLHRQPTLEMQGEPGGDEILFAASSGRVAQRRGGHTLHAWDAATGQVADRSGTWADSSASLQVDEAGTVQVRFEDTEVTLEAGRFGVRAASVSPDRSRVATACDDRAVRLWDASTGQLLLTLRCNAAAVDVAFSPDGHRLAGLDAEGQVRVWNATPLEGAEVVADDNRTR